MYNRLALAFTLFIGLILFLMVMPKLRAQQGVTPKAIEPRHIAFNLYDTKILNDMAQSEKLKEAIFRQLTVNNKWRVTEKSGAIVAIRSRTNEQGSGINDGAQSLISLRFGPYTRTATNLTANRTVCLAGEKSVSLALVPSAIMSSQFDSFLVIRSGEDDQALFLEIWESSNDPNRKATERALNEIVEELKLVRTHINEIMENGFAQEITPAGSISEGDSKISIEPGIQKGIYHVSGFVNAGEKGYVTIEVQEATTGKLIAQVVMPSRTLQYVGWSKDVRRKFAFSSEVTMNDSPSGIVGDHMDVVFRLVFHPIETRTLVEQPRRVQIWQR